jgi:dTDP-4-dehydrorhamnose reductase
LKVLITGAGGFLGKYFAQHLGHDTHALDRSTLDLTNSEQVKFQLKSGQYDVIIHCASVGRNTAKSFDTNIIQNNLCAFSNLVSCRHDFGMLINFATGAEFDIDSNIENVTENEIWNRNPLHSYGRSKNIIARQVQMLSNFYNLRIFGCFDASEADNRPLQALLRKHHTKEPFVIPADRYFDMFSVADILTVTEAVMAKQVRDKDLNLVYNKKHTLSEILIMFAKLHNLDHDMIQVQSLDQNHYTGNGSGLAQYNLDLLGLEQSLLNYCI